MSKAPNLLEIAKMDARKSRIDKLSGETELEQGVIDGQENPLWVMGVYKFYEIQKYMTMTRHVYSSLLTLM